MTKSKIQDGERMPKLGIGIPIYNGEDHIGPLLDSILSQEFTDFEVTVCDNASSDETGRICREYAARDPRIRYHRNDRNIGAVSNFNRVYELSRGQYFMWMSHDDTYEPDYFERCIGVLDARPDIVLCHAGTKLIDPDGALMPYDEARDCYIYKPDNSAVQPHSHNLAEQSDPVERFRDFFAEEYFGTYTFGVMRRDALARTCLMKNFYASDEVTLIELAFQGRFHMIEDRLFSKRYHPGSSYFLTEKEKFTWVNTADKRSFFERYFSFTAAYIHAILRAKDLTLWQKLRCLGPVIAKTLSGMWSRLTGGLFPSSSDESYPTGTAQGSGAGR